MSTVKVICTVRKGYLMSLPGNIKVWGGAVTKIPAELLNNPGVKAYLKSGRLKLVDEADAVILPLQSPPEAPAPVAPVVPEPEATEDPVAEAAPVEVAPEPEIVAEAPTKKEKKKKAAEEAVQADEPPVAE